MPLTTSQMQDHLAGNVTNIVPIWKITSRGGLTAAYAAHTRPTVGRLINGAPLFTFGGVTYKPANAQPSRDSQRIGLAPNGTQLSGLLDDVITRVDVENGRWKLAKIVYEYVNCLDLSIGSTSRMVGVAGQWSIQDPAYEVEIVSNGQLLQQLIGEATSPTDRNMFPAGVSKPSWIVSRNVVSSADRRHLVIDGAAKPDHYFKYGIIVWISGSNVKSLGMEIKDNTGNTIELQLPMPADIKGPSPGPADTVTLLAGYDGTREQARDRFADVIDFNGEPDLPGLNTLFSYPE